MDNDMFHNSREHSLQIPSNSTMTQKVKSSCCLISTGGGHAKEVTTTMRPFSMMEFTDSPESSSTVEENLGDHVLPIIEDYYTKVESKKSTGVQ